MFSLTPGMVETDIFNRTLGTVLGVSCTLATITQAYIKPINPSKKRHVSGANINGVTMHYL